MKLKTKHILLLAAVAGGAYLLTRKKPAAQPAAVAATAYGKNEPVTSGDAVQGGGIGLFDVQGATAGWSSFVP